MHHGAYLVKSWQRKKNTARRWSEWANCCRGREKALENSIGTEKIS